MNDIRSVLRAYILENLLPGEDPSNLTDDTELKESGILDSMSTLKLVTYLEEQFAIEFAAADLEPANLSSIAALQRLVQSKL
ncbi:MAG: acyl carrier protein [Steroidobacteraceae bacterium]|nr:acyl carrier protein [Steroidobacteraceae bacterium]